MKNNTNSSLPDLSKLSNGMILPGSAPQEPILPRNFGQGQGNDALTFGANGGIGGTAGSLQNTGGTLGTLGGGGNST